MTANAETFAAYNAEYGFHPHAMQVETKSGQSWMTVHNSYLDGLHELDAVIEQWGFDEIDAVTFAILPMPNSDHPNLAVGEGGAWSVEQVAAAMRLPINDVQKLLVNAKGNRAADGATGGGGESHGGRE